MSVPELQALILQKMAANGPISDRMRQDVLDIIVSGGGGHIGGDMSVLDILVMLFFKHRL